MALTASVLTLSGCCTPTVTSTNICVFESIPKRADHRQGGMMQGVLHRANRRLCVVAAVQVVAGAEFQDDSFAGHVLFVRSGSGDVKPDHRGGAGDQGGVGALLVGYLQPALHARRRCRCRAAGPRVPRLLSTCSGCGTPIVTSTCIASVSMPRAAAMLRELCQSASRSARTAALVGSAPPDIGAHADFVHHAFQCHVWSPCVVS